MSGPTSSRTSAHRHVVLAHVHPVGARLGRDAGRSLTISSAPSRSHSALRGEATADELVVGEVLLAQLHDVDAAGDRGAQQVGQLALRRPHAVGHAAHTRYRRARSSRSRRSVCAVGSHRRPLRRSLAEPGAG